MLIIHLRKYEMQMGMIQTIDSSSILTLNCFILFIFPGIIRRHHVHAISLEYSLPFQP